MKRALQYILISTFFLISCSENELIFENALCIENINTIDPEDGLREYQTIVIKEGKILKIFNSQDSKLSSTNKIIDGTGLYLIPGLWDAHVHFAYNEALAPSMFDLFLGYGITSVRDTGGKIDVVKYWKDKSLANPTSTPRVMISGPLLDGTPNVYDGSPMRPELSVGLKDQSAVIQQIEILDSIGVDFLKAYEMLTPEQFATVAQQAKLKGLKVTGHVPLSMDVIAASNGGLNSMEHLRNLELSCASNSQELLEQRRELLKAGLNDQGGVLRSRIHDLQRQNAIENYDPKKAVEVLSVLAKNETWQIPTMALQTVFVTKPFMDPHWQESFSYLPDSISNSWKSTLKNIMGMEVTDFQKEYAQWKKVIVKNIYSEKIDIMAGTDTPIAFLTPGLSLHEELSILASCGISSLDVLKMATTIPAKYFNMEKELGSIKENMWADLLILNENPLENINHTKNINSVIKQGKVFSREELDSILQNAANN